jgi:hypothetical protein
MVELITLVITLAGVLATVFNRTNRLLGEIRDVLIEIRDLK